MALKKITEADLQGVGVIGLPDTPGLSAADMQAKFEETGRQVIIPAFNSLVDALLSGEGESGAAQVGAYDRAGAPTTVQAHLLDTANPHRVTAAQIGAVSEERARQLIAEAAFESGSADMFKAVYDPQNRAADIFAYVDSVVDKAVTQALNREV